MALHPCIPAQCHTATPPYRCTVPTVPIDIYPDSNSMTIQNSEIILNEFKNLRVGETPLFPVLSKQEIMDREKSIPINLPRLEDSQSPAPLKKPMLEEFEPHWHPLWLDVFEAARQLHFEFIDCSIIASAWIRQSMRAGEFDCKTWPTQWADFGLVGTALISSSAKAVHHERLIPCPTNLGLYAVAPNSESVKKLALLQVPTIQLRFKSSDPSALEEQVQNSVNAVKGTGSLLFINDHWRLAIKANAYGIHLGQEDLDKLTSPEINAIRESGLRVGISTHGYSEMFRADKFGPSYIAMGAIYPTTLKQMQTLPQGVERLRMYVKLMNHYPLVAIGGIDASNIQEVLSTGVGSVAMVRALVGADVRESEILKLLSVVKF